MNIRDLILAAADIKTEKVDVPEWGTTVYLKQMDGLERIQWAMAAFDDQGKATDHFREKLLVRCLTDEAGQLIFSDEDLVALGKKNGAVILRLYNSSRIINGLTAEAVDDAAKN